MEIIGIKGYLREKTGKEYSKKLRRGGRVPAILYGHGMEPVRMSVDAAEILHLTHGDTRTSHLVKINMDEDKKSHTAIFKHIEKHPIREDLLHIDFQVVRMDEKIHSTVPVRIVGEEAGKGLKTGGVLQHIAWEIEISSLPGDIPEYIEADVSELEIGESLKASDLKIPPEVELLTNQDDVILSIILPTVFVEEVPEEVAEGEEVTEPEEIKPEREGKEGESSE